MAQAPFSSPMGQGTCIRFVLRMGRWVYYQDVAADHILRVSIDGGRPGDGLEQRLISGPLGASRRYLAGRGNKCLFSVTADSSISTFKS